MKKTLLVICSALVLIAGAQPVIMNGDNIPDPGYSATVYVASPTSGIGNPGANQNWDFSTISLTPAGTLEVILPASSPIGGAFPSANFAYTFAGTYSFFNVASDKMEVLAYSIVTPGTGNDYTPGPRTVLKFPFNYGDSETDSWQKVGGSLETVTITYDGYGTLITPLNTYTNVVRIKEDYDNGDIDYQWYILDPLLSILVYDHNADLFYYTGATVTGLPEPTGQDLAVSVYPNPATENLSVQIDESYLIGKPEFRLIDPLGRMIKQISIDRELTNVKITNLPSGIYHYQLIDGHSILQNGKVIVE